MHSKYIIITKLYYFPAIEPIVLVIVNDMGISARKKNNNKIKTLNLCFAHRACLMHSNSLKL